MPQSGTHRKYFTAEEVGKQQNRAAAVRGGLDTFAPGAVPEGALKAAECTRIDIDLSTAQVEGREFPYAGDVIEFPYAADASGPISTALVNVSFDQASNPKVPFLPGRSQEGASFQRLFISWAAQPGASVVLIVWKNAAGRQVRIG